MAAFAGDAAKWAAPIAPRHVEPPRSDVHPVDAFLGTEKALVADAVFARRAYLDLWGLLPTPAQLGQFEKDGAQDKRERLIDHLLADKENYSSHWITFWNDLLRNDEGVGYAGERKSITPWLKQALAENLPYDKFVAKLLNPAQPGDPEGFLTGVNWRGVVNASELPPMQAAQNSAQIFLGINLKCNSCHDSFISTWKLKDAYGLASFFASGPLELVRCDVKQGKTAETKFLFPELGDVPQGMTLAERRAAAVRLFTQPENGRFARTYVNRIWAQLLGIGIVANVDDMAAKPSNVDLLDWLASDFVDHGYDSKRLIRTIMTSRAYQAPATRRMSAEQFMDAVASITGEWRVVEDKAAKGVVSAREWRFKSTPLSRALGRPIRDQVTTVRLTQPATLQALELVNGNTLATMLRRGALRMLDQLPPAPRSLFDSGVVRGAKSKPQLEVDITGLDELWLLMVDVDSYDAAHVRADWADAELSGPEGSVRLAELTSVALPFEKKLDLRGKGYRKLKATVALEAASTTSDINGSVRFFVFGAKPDYDHLSPPQGAPPVEAVRVADFNLKELVRYLWRYAFAREPLRDEMRLAAASLDAAGKSGRATRLEDLLWSMVMSPEFQYIL